jgi:hypothetical protein
MNEQNTRLGIVKEMREKTLGEISIVTSDINSLKRSSSEFGTSYWKNPLYVELTERLDVHKAILKYLDDRMATLERVGKDIF